ncbi:MAG: hypothetical protein FWF68_03835 [Spirochaetes bacterium]|nr:hypothetical protein [Spirochaetota bacterium]
MKKGLIFMFLAILIAGAVFAQNNAKKEEQIKNWISGEASIIGGGVRYERMLSENLSIGANVYYSTLFFFWNEMEAGVSARFYPFSSSFFVGAGVGFHWHSGLGLSSTTGITAKSIVGVAISPELGWKIDVGKPGGFFIQPGVKVPITIGSNSISYWGYVDKKFGVGVGVVPYFGLGLAF